jgi:hypothetical protein
MSVSISFTPRQEVRDHAFGHTWQIAGSITANTAASKLWGGELTWSEGCDHVKGHVFVGHGEGYFGNFHEFDGVPTFSQALAWFESLKDDSPAFTALQTSLVGVSYEHYPVCNGRI